MDYDDYDVSREDMVNEEEQYVEFFIMEVNDFINHYGARELLDRVSVASYDKIIEEIMPDGD